MALVTARAENLDRYNEHIQYKEQQWLAMNPEAGSCEQNFSEEIPFRDIPPSRVFQIKRSASANAVSSFATGKCLKDFGPRLMSEILKFISTFKLSTISGEDYDPEEVHETVPDSYISAAALYRQIFTDDTMMGLYEFLMTDARSVFLDKQYTAPGRSYCALVPLIMYAFKAHKNVPYEHWNKRQVEGITSPRLYTAMTYRSETLFGKDDILAARAEGLLVKTGIKQGTSRNPVHTFKLYGASAFKGMPELQQVMLAQIWCAHPDNRTKFMVLDPFNWDRIPPPLVQSEKIFTTDTFNSPNELPWDA